MNPNSQNQKSELGLIYGIAAYSLWGLIPIYIKTVREVPAVEVLAHRAIWSFVVLAVLVACFKRWPELIGELRNRKLRLMLALSTVCIGTNWLIFIYAVNSDQVLQTSLGYFITPLVSVLLGVVVLRERLRSMQIVSFLLAMSGMLMLALYSHAVPWIALTLATSFGLYGLLRKLMPVDGLISLTVETFFMLPIAVAYLAWHHGAGQGSPRTPLLYFCLLLGGPVTTTPLLFFGAAARRLRLSTMGILQYLAPSISFLLAVVVYREPFLYVQAITCGMIWTAIAIYTTDSLWAARQSRFVVADPLIAEEPVG